MTMRMFWADSRGKVVLVLVSLWLSAAFYRFRINALLFPFLAVVCSYVLDTCLSRVRYGVWFFSLSSCITGLLIGLIVDPTSITVLLTAVVLASVSKYVLGFGRQKHAFNPAAFGIVVSSAVLNRPVAWWAASWSVVPVFIIVLGMLLPLGQLRRFWMPITFLFVYGIGLAWVSGIESALKLTFDPAVLLFAWIMLTEPMTAPSRGFWRYGWGVSVGMLVIGELAFSVSWSDPLLMALLAANGFGFFLTRVL